MLCESGLSLRISYTVLTFLLVVMWTTACLRDEMECVYLFKVDVRKQQTLLWPPDQEPKGGSSASRLG